MTPTKSASVKKKASPKKATSKTASAARPKVAAKTKTRAAKAAKKVVAPEPKTKAAAKKKTVAAASKKKTVAPASKKKTAGPAPKKKTVAPAPKKKAAAAAPKKKAVAAASKKKAAAAAPKKKAAAAAPKKSVAPKAQAAAPEKKVVAAEKKAAAPRKKTLVAAKPRAISEPPVEVVVQRPAERPLTDEEREAMQKCAQTALAALAADGVPEVIVTRIGRFIDEVRAGALPEPANQDVRLGLGVLWGEQVRAQVGWRWVHLSYPNGFASYALVPDDRAFACFPLNRLGELLRTGADGVNTSVPLFDSIRVGTLPLRSENAYLVIG
jgi:hypothetical protein